MASVRRRRTDEMSQRASTLELFYDLVFVFAITQVSHLLLEHLTWAGAGQALIVLLAVWWSWNYTTWTTNELDTETIPVRLLLLALMLVSLLMAVAIPDAFGEHALLFAGSYVAIQVGRHAFLTFAAAEPGVVRGGGGAVDRGRARGRACANGAVAGRARARLRSAARPVLGTGTATTRRRHVERRDRALCRALRAIHHPRFGRVHSLDRRHYVRVRPGSGDDRCLHHGLPRKRGHLVAVLHVRGEARRALPCGLRDPDQARQGRLHIFARGVRCRDHHGGGRRRASDRPPNRGPATTGGHSGGSGSGHISGRTHPLRLQTDGGTEQEEALRDAGLRRGRLRWPVLPGTGSRGASHRGTSGGNRVELSPSIAKQGAWGSLTHRAARSGRCRQMSVSRTTAESVPPAVSWAACSPELGSSR